MAKHEPKLTPEAVRAMEAGPETDALVAERVLGCTSTPYGWRSHSEDMVLGMLFQPSRGIACAWRVVESLRAQGYVWRIEQSADGWFAALAKPGQPYRGYEADSVALSICRSALLVGLAEGE